MTNWFKATCPKAEQATLFWSDNNRLWASHHVISTHDRYQKYIYQTGKLQACSALLQTLIHYFLKWLDALITNLLKTYRNMLKLVEICTHIHTRMWWYAVSLMLLHSPLVLSMQLCGEMDQHWLSKGFVFGHTPHVVSWKVAPSLHSPHVHIWLQSSCPMLTERKVCLLMALDSNRQAQGYWGLLIDLCHFFVSALLKDTV